MLLAIDIGNSTIKFGVFDGKRLVSKFSIPTNYRYGPDEITRATGNQINRSITAAIACSVVPQVDNAVREFAKRSFGIDTFFIDNGFDFGLKVDYCPVSALGTDRLVNAFGAVEKYGAKPCIVCSLGTATTIDAISADGEFLGGVIAPGMRTMAKALHLAAAKLPEVNIEMPASLLGRTTAGSIRSGIFYGQLSMIEGMIGRISAELGGQPLVVATGGFARMLAAGSGMLKIVNEDLLLEALNLLSRRLYS